MLPAHVDWTEISELIVMLFLGEISWHLFLIVSWWIWSGECGAKSVLCGVLARRGFRLVAVLRFRHAADDGRGVERSEEPHWVVLSADHIRCARCTHLTLPVKRLWWKPVAVPLCVALLSSAVWSHKWCHQFSHAQVWRAVFQLLITARK